MFQARRLLLLLTTAALLLPGAVGCVGSNTRSYSHPDLQIDRLKSRFGVLGFTGGKEDYQQMITDAVTFELLDRGFTIIERSQLAPIFKEFEMSQTGLIKEGAKKALD